jgi:xylulokinase
VDSERLVETHAFPGGLYHLGNPGWLCGGAVRWASALLGCASDAQFMALAEEAPPGCDGLVFIPALTGAMAPRWNPAARGSFIGLAAGHERGHMARAVLEGTAFAVRDVVERLAALGAASDRLRLMGGGARSRLWCGIKADVTGLPAEIQDVADASALGAALIAAVAAGIAPTLAEAIRRRECDLPFITPQPSCREAYDKSYRFYRDVFAALDPYWPVVDGAMSTTRRSMAER